MKRRTQFKVIRLIKKVNMVKKLNHIKKSMMADSLKLLNQCLKLIETIHLTNNLPHIVETVKRVIKHTREVL